MVTGKWYANLIFVKSKFGEKNEDAQCAQGEWRHGRRGMGRGARKKGTHHWRGQVFHVYGTAGDHLCTACRDGFWMVSKVECNSRHPLNTPKVKGGKLKILPLQCHTSPLLFTYLHAPLLEATLSSVIARISTVYDQNWITEDPANATLLMGPLPTKSLPRGKTTGKW